MIERLIIVVVLFLVGFIGYRLYTQRQMKRLSTMDVDSIRKQLKPGVPAVVYFTTPNCIPCKTQQMPAIDKLRETLGDDEIQVIKVDATEDPDAASRWGVMTAPTTFVLDETGEMKAINHGVADSNKLQKQLIA